MSERPTETPDPGNVTCRWCMWLSGPHPLPRKRWTSDLCTCGNGPMPDDIDEAHICYRHPDHVKGHTHE